jgi:hypothetical protein
MPPRPSSDAARRAQIEGFILPGGKRALAAACEATDQALRPYRSKA